MQVKTLPQNRTIRAAQVIRNTAATNAAMGTPAQQITTVAGGGVQTFDVNVDPHWRDLASHWRDNGQGQTVAVPDAMAHKRTTFSTNTDIRMDAELESKPPADGEDVHLTATISTNEIDRYDTIIEPRGGDFGNYQSNPVLLWAHGHDPKEGMIAIGAVKAIRVSDDKIEVDLYFFGDTPLGNKIGQMYAKKQLRGFSIGFIPKSYHVEMIDEKHIIRFVAWELVELSAVSVPANASALARSIEQRQIDFGVPALADYVGNCVRTANGGGDVLDYVCSRFGMPALNQSQQVQVVPVGVEMPSARGPVVRGDSAQPQRTPAATNQVMVPGVIARSLDSLLTSLGHQPGIESGSEAATTLAVQTLQDLAKTRGAISRGDLANITARLAADLRVDWDGLFDPAEVCRGLTPANIEQLAAFVVDDGVSRQPKFLHHRGDGSISWPALAGCMAELITNHCGLTEQNHRMVYDHLAAHYQALGIQTPEYRFHTPDEAYDLALAGCVALDRGGTCWMFNSVHQRSDGALVPMFRDVRMNRTAEFEVPGLGRLQNPELWGRRALPDNRGMEMLLQQLQQTQSRLVESQTSAGASFTQYGRSQLQSVAESLAAAEELHRQALQRVQESLTFVRGVVSADGTVPSQVIQQIAGGSPAIVGVAATPATVDQMQQPQPAAGDVFAAVQDQFVRQMVAPEPLSPTGQALAGEVLTATPATPATPIQ